MINLMIKSQLRIFRFLKIIQLHYLKMVKFSLGAMEITVILVIQTIQLKLNPNR